MSKESAVKIAYQSAKRLTGEGKKRNLVDFVVGFCGSCYDVAVPKPEAAKIVARLMRAEGLLDGLR